MFSINWERIEKWKSLPEEILISTNNQDYETLEAKHRELQNWTDYQVYDEVEDSGENYITVQWVITQKYENEKRLVKARLVARGFQEDRSYIRKDSPTVTREGLRLLMCLTVSKKWKIQSLDIKSAFLQGNSLKRAVFIKPPVEANTKKLWRLNKCVYGLSDASRMWYLKVDKCFKDMKLEKMSLDEAFYVMRDQGEIVGLICMHVDDIIWAGNTQFKENVIQQLKKQFEISKESEGEFVYLGLRVKQTDKGISVDQYHYIESLTDPEIEVGSRKKVDQLNKEECKILKRFSGQLAWAAKLSRPDISFGSCEISVGVENSTVSDVVKLGKTLRKLRQNNIQIKFVPLTDIGKCSIVVYSDASHANLKGSASQAGYVMFLVDSAGKANILKWQSKKISRVIKSTLAAETLALLEGAENAYFVKQLMVGILGKVADIGIHCLTDNKSLVDSVNSTNTLTDYRLRIDMACLRNMVSNGELSSVNWVKTEDQLADCLPLFAGAIFPSPWLEVLVSTSTCFK